MDQLMLRNVQSIADHQSDVDQSMLRNVSQSTVDPQSDVDQSMLRNVSQSIADHQSDVDQSMLRNVSQSIVDPQSDVYHLMLPLQLTKLAANSFHGYFVLVATKTEQKIHILQDPSKNKFLAKVLHFDAIRFLFITFPTGSLEAIDLLQNFPPCKIFY